MSAAAAALRVSTYEAGQRGTESYRVFFKRDGETISPWHDLPLSPAPGLYTMVNEIPRGTNAKMEIAPKEKFNPIKQDVKKGALRFMKYGNVLHNYGALPQTWEDPGHVNSDVDNLPGDNDPLDVIDLGQRPLAIGEIATVKALGLLGLIDDNECDWKIIAINVEDPLAAKLNGIDDVEREMPGAISAIREWYRLYKTVDGKPENAYAFDGDAKDKGYAEKIIDECHSFWKALKAGQVDARGAAL